MTHPRVRPGWRVADTWVGRGETLQLAAGDHNDGDGPLTLVVFDIIDTFGEDRRDPEWCTVVGVRPGLPKPTQCVTGVRVSALAAPPPCDGRAK